MQKVRVYQLAKELKVQSALILELLDRLGEDVKSDLSTLDLGTADLVREKVTMALRAEKRRLAREREEQEATPEETPVPFAEEPQPAEAAEAAKPAEPVEPQEQEQEKEEAPAAEPAEQPEPIAAAPPKPAAPPARQPAPTPTPPSPAVTTGEPARPGAPRPRVFPARRIPTAAALAKARAARVGAARPAAGAPATRPGLPGRPVPGMTSPPPPGRRVPPGAKKRRKKDRSRETVSTLPPKERPDLPPVPEEITLSEGVTVKELAEKLNRKSKDVISKLIARGVLATINQPLNPDVAIDVAKEFGSKAKVISFEEEAQAPDTSEAAAGLDVEEAASGEEIVRPPVVTVMGHVDHGKTSLLDALRTTNVVDREAGGITQHIGAYQVEEKGRKITLLDTPGHEAFTMMRARGARATDIVVLVVAADDGVKPQTVEAIDHAKAAGVPIVIAVNKIDKPNADPDRVKQQLMEQELVVEDYGGDIVACEVSAKQKTGLDHLMEMILLVADLKELKADPKRSATGIVLEARLDRSRGILATVLVQNGTLEAGDSFIAGTAYGKVRAMNDQHGRKIQSAGPATPVEVMGFAGEPTAGDPFQAVADEAKARQIASFRQEKDRAEKQRATARTSLEAFSSEIAEGQTKELRLLLKGDVSGSLEALQKSLGELPSDKIRVRVLRSSIGAITQADVLLASASDALIVGFNVRPDRAASDLAKREKVELRMYTVIYELLDDIRAAMLGMLEPTLKEAVLGQATVRQPFKIPKIGTIAGSYVTEGKVTRNAEVRLLRDNVVIFTGKVSSLKRFKDDASEVKLGFECGIGIANYNDIKEGDVIEFFEIQKIKQKTL